MLHLTPIHGYHLDIQCDAPTSLVLPVESFKPVLRDRKLPVTVQIDGESVTITSASGLSLTLPGHAAAEYPAYHRVLALDAVTPTARTACDLALLAKFTAFAKAMGQPPHLDFAFHGPISPASIHIAGLSGFYGVLMPRQMAFEEAIPTWLLPVETAPDSTERVIRLHDLDGGIRASRRPPIPHSVRCSTSRRNGPVWTVAITAPGRVTTMKLALSPVSGRRW